MIVLDDMRGVDGQHEVRDPLSHRGETGRFAEIGDFDGAAIEWHYWTAEGM